MPTCDCLLSVFMATSLHSALSHLTSVCLSALCVLFGNLSAQNILIIRITLLEKLNACFRTFRMFDHYMSIMQIVHPNLMIRTTP